MTVLDRAALVRRLMGDEELATEILTGFVEDASDQLIALSLAVEDGDAPTVQHLAHSMKGAAVPPNGCRVTLDYQRWESDD